MQKKSRFLTGLLSAVMALTLFALPATAETPKSVINPGAKGSITVHKYEYGGTEEKNGTGNATDGVPKDATPLNGAGFTVYKIWDTNTLMQYYDGQSKVDNLAQVLDWNNYASKEADGSYKLVLKNGCKATLAKAQQKTGENGAETGVTKFDGLEVGLYLVLETEVPDQVKEAAVPAIISLPMQKDSANNVSPAKDVTEWMYDIHIFPKNSTSYSGAKLVKKGYTGEHDDGTIKNVKFKLFKYNGTAENPEYTENSSNEWTELTNKTTAEGENKGETLTLVTNADGEISVDGLAKGKYCFVEQGMIKADGSAANTAYIISKKPVYFNVTAESVVYKGDKTTTKDGKEAALVENYKPDIEKKVQKSDNTLDKRADYNVGDLVPYVVTVDVPKNIASLKVFTVTDTPTNLEFVNDDVNHKLVVTSGDGETVIPSGYTLTEEGKGFKLAFTQGTLDTYAGKKIKIKYYDKLLKAATGNTTGKNTVALIYNNKLGTDGTPEGTGDGNTTKIQDDAVVYSFGIKVKKTDGKGDGLDGVKFDLYRVDATGDKKLADFGWTGATEQLKLVESGLVTTNGGNISVTGLANGEYYLVETETLPGYNMLSKAVKVDLKITYAKSWTDEKTYDKDGNLIHWTTTNFTEEFTNGDQGEGVNPTFLTTKVINRKGFTLPRTGGFGTLLFSGIGALLVVGGVGVLMGTKKKKDNA